MAIAYVKECATNNNTTTTAAHSVTITAAPAAGNTVVAVLRTGPSTTSGYSYTITDSKSNTWTVDASFNNGQNEFMVIASTRQNAGALTTSDTVTFTLNTTRAANAPTLTWIEEFSGMASSSYVTGTPAGVLDQAGDPQSGTVTPSVADALMVGFIDVHSSTATLTINEPGTVGTYSSFTTTQLTSTGSVNRISRPVYQVLSGGSGVGQKHVWSVSQFVDDSSLLTAYAPAASAAASVSLHYPSSAVTTRSTRW